MGESFSNLLRGRVGKEFDYAGYRFRRAQSADERESAYRLRHRVYAEQGFIEARGGADACFRDEFDEVAEHITVHDADDRLVGTTRLVLPSPLGFPTEGLFDFDPPACPRDRLGEFGRLAIVGAHRGGSRVPMLGMIKMVYETLREREIEFVYAFMPPALIASYTALGLISQPLALRATTPATLARRRPMRGYFSRQEIRPVLFGLEEMEREIGV